MSLNLGAILHPSPVSRARKPITITNISWRKKIAILDKLCLLCLFSSPFPGAGQVPKPVLCRNSAVEEMKTPWLLSLHGRKTFHRFWSRETSQALLWLHLVPTPASPNGTCPCWGFLGAVEEEPPDLLPSQSVSQIVKLLNYSLAKGTVATRDVAQNAALTQLPHSSTFSMFPAL